MTAMNAIPNETKNLRILFAQLFLSSSRKYLGEGEENEIFAVKLLSGMR
jgi:hypothetical protein